ncbi:MAG: hypothetical protein JSC189_000633 [Candidatus Tokpelaia sp. JSC189]|nr:MAG: hypothetical protein JSC189_000633 [Candidatus Tokpelaia sp. JSC189]
MSVGFYKIGRCSDNFSESFLLVKRCNEAVNVSSTIYRV